MKPEKVVCQNCVFWRLQREGDEGDPAYELAICDGIVVRKRITRGTSISAGSCHRYPKRQGGLDWNHWCGEWSDTWPAGWIEYEEPAEPETVEAFQFLGGGSLPK